MTAIEGWAKGCLGKRQYRTFTYAEKQAEFLGQRFHVTYRVYWCKDCGGYHLTTHAVCRRLQNQELAR